MKAANIDRLTSISLSEAVRERLLRLIVRGDLLPGARLNEVHLAESFGVSRGPIREAARELEGQGFLISRVNQGFFVADCAPAEIRDIHEAKNWLEAAFVADIADHMDIATRRAILADISSIDETDRAAFTETLFRFRLRVAAHIRNRFLADLIVTLYRKLYLVAAVAQVGDELGDRLRTLSTLRDFWTAIVLGDIPRAGEILRTETARRLAEGPRPDTR